MPTRPRPRPRNRVVIFDVIDSHLVRKVCFPGDDDRSYTHRCTRQVFEQVAHAIDERADRGATLPDLAREEDLPFTQVSVALDFMLERGCLVTRFRRHYPASNALHLDAMTEFTFLADLPY